MTNCEIMRDYLLTLDLTSEMSENPDQLFYQELLISLTYNDIHHRIVLRFSRDEDVIHVVFINIVKYDVNNTNKLFKIYELLNQMNLDCFFSKFEMDMEDYAVVLNFVYNTHPDTFDPDKLFDIMANAIQDITKWYPALMKLKWGSSN